MATNQYQAHDQFEQGPPVKRRSWMTGCLIGCLVVIVIALVLGTLATIWVSRNIKSLAVSGLSMVFKQAIDQSDLPQEEKDQIKAEVDRAANAVLSGQMSNEQATKMVELLFQSPLMTVIIATPLEKKYLDQSGLNDEEKTEARVTLTRFLRGAFDKKIDQPTVESAMSHVTTKQGEQVQLKDKITDEELRAFLAEAKQAADDAGVPEQPPEIDPSDEVKRVIDEAMGTPAGAPPAIEIPAPTEVPSAIETRPEAEAPPEPTTEN